MARFLIEVPHEPYRASCDRAVEIFLKSGSHFLTHADWGCKDGEHKAWFIAEVESKAEARSIVPPAYRAQAKITELIQYDYDIEQADEMFSQHAKA